MKNGRCRMHGGKSTGPPKGSQNNLRHGHYTKEAIQRRREVRASILWLREMARIVMQDANDEVG